MVTIDVHALIFLLIWSFIGGILGFLSFTRTTLPLRPKHRFQRCCLSVLVGMFIALPTYLYLYEEEIFSQKMSILIGGLCSFGLSDFIIKNWPELLKRIVGKLETKVDKKIENKSRL